MGKKFLFLNIAWFLLVGVAYFTWAKFGWPGYHPKAQVTNIFFFLLTLNIHFVGLFANKKYKEQFALIYMLGIVSGGVGRKGPNNNDFAPLVGASGKYRK